MPIHLRVLTAVVSGQIACGFTLGASGTALFNTSKYVTISDLQAGLIGAGSLIGPTGNILIGRLPDRIGGRKLLMLNMYILGILSLMQLLTNNLPTLFIIRVLIGLMIAVDYIVGNALLTEQPPKGKDSKKQGHLPIYWTTGFIASYLTGTPINGFGSHTWQIVLTTGAIPAFIAAIFRSIFPLSALPGWLASHGKVETASKAIKKRMGRKWGIPKRLKKAKPVREVSQTMLFSGKYLRRTLVGGLFYACQAFAFFSISIFLPTLLQSMQLTDQKISDVIYSGGILIRIILGILLFSRINRHIFPTSSSLLLGILIGFLAITKNLNSDIQPTIFCIFAVISSSGLVLDYPYLTELFDIKVRGTGVGTYITISRFGAVAGTFLLPILTNQGGTSLSILICAIVILTALIIYLIQASEASLKFK